MNATKEALELNYYVDNQYKDTGFLTARGPSFAEATVFPLDVLACSQPIASGSFRIEGSSFSHYAQLVPTLRSEETKGVGMSAPKRNDAAMSGAMLKAMQASSSEAWKDQIMRIVILDPDWFIERHPISGAILFRYIRAEVAVKGRDGKCSFYQLCTFKQDYVGGKFGATRYDGHGDRQSLPRVPISLTDRESAPGSAANAKIELTQREVAVNFPA